VWRGGLSQRGWRRRRHENRSRDRHQCVLAEQLGCVRVQQQLAKETKVIAALKQHYERYHAEDLAVLKELYEYHAENCVRAAELTDDPRRREEYLKLAREWTEGATTIQELTYRMMARRSNQAKPADDAPSLTSPTRRRMATRNPRKRPVSDN
jgi:hypothetical protein